VVWAQLSSVGILGAFPKLRKVNMSFLMFVCPSAWNNPAATGRIFIKFVIFDYLSKNLLGKLEVPLKSDTNDA
jgi:hypothetical protein